MNKNTIIELVNVTKTYDNGHTIALDNLNLKINTGSSVSIMGPSGSGKSTLLNIIGALDTPDSGHIQINNINLQSVKNLSKFRRNTIGFVFQLHNLIPNLTMQENVELPMYGRGTPKDERRSRSRELLDGVGLGDLCDKRPNILSGGERQRVAVARALVNNPRIILADEPTGSLDLKNGQMIIDLLKEQQEELGVTLVVVTHEPEVAMQMNQHIKIKNGNLT